MQRPGSEKLVFDWLDQVIFPSPVVAFCTWAIEVFHQLLGSDKEADFSEARIAGATDGSSWFPGSEWGGLCDNRSNRIWMESVDDEYMMS